MNPEEKREVYELTRRAVRHELRAMVHDFMATAIGIVLFVPGLLAVVGQALGGSLFAPETAISAVIGLLGLLMIAITWKWDRWLRRHLPVGGTAQK